MTDGGKSPCFRALSFSLQKGSAMVCIGLIGIFIAGILGAVGVKYIKAREEVRNFFGIIKDWLRGDDTI